MTMTYDQWERILSTVNEEKDLNKNNVIKKIGEKLEAESKSEYEQWKKVDCGVNCVFTVIQEEEPYGCTLLHLAAECGYAEIVSVLTESGAWVNAVIGRFSDGTPLHLAAGKGHKEVVEVLIKKGAIINAIDALGFTPVHLAAENGQLDTVKSTMFFKTF